SALAAVPENIVGIANADIVFEPTSQWRESLPQSCRNAVVTGHRLDTSSLLRGGLNEYAFGFDYFFFERSAAGDISPQALPYAIGVPWWDYWVPFALALTGRTLSTCTRPHIIHLSHEAAWNPVQAKQMAKVFAGFILGAKENLRTIFHTDSAPLISLCDAVSAISDTGEEPNKAEANAITKLAKLCSSILGTGRFAMAMPNRESEPGSNFVETGRAQFPGASLVEIFHSVEDR